MKGLRVGLLVSGLVVAPAGCRLTSRAPQPLRIGLYTSPLTRDPHLHNGRARRALPPAPGDAGDLLESTLHTRDLARGFGAANYGRYSNRGLDALIESAARAPQLEARRRILQECLRLALADLAIVPLFVREQLYGFRSEVAWQARADGRLLAQDLRRISQESPWPTRR